MKLRLPLIFIAVLGLAAAAYLGVSLARSPNIQQALLSRPGQRRDFNLIPATQLPQTQADLLGAGVAVRDNSLMVRPITKGPSDPSNPPVEVVMTAATQVFMDTTDERTGTIVNGALHQTLAAFEVTHIQATDTVVVWGSRRGDRLTAEVLVDERNH